MGHYLVYFAVAVLFTWMLLMPCRTMALRYQLVWHDAKGQTSRRKNLPLLGGLALYFGFMFALLVAFFWQIPDQELSIAIPHHQLLAILIGSVLVCLIGLIGDVYRVPGSLRVVIYLLAGMLLVFAGVSCRFSFFDIGSFNLRGVTLSLGNSLATLLWVGILIGAVNLLERVDGMLVGLATIIAIFLFVLAIVAHDYTSSLFCLLFVGSLLGILWELMPPATLLLGKMGSGFIGFMLAVLSLQTMASLSNFLLNQYTNNLAYVLPLVVPLLLIAIPILVAVALAIRKIAGKPASLEMLLADCRQYGASESYLLTVAYAVTAGMGLSALVMCWVTSAMLTFALLGLAALTMILLLAQLLVVVKK
jgi:UDP-GlcNAc:undecaprenyl-phosphate GlcNAc-1-phosphate transferase